MMNTLVEDATCLLTNILERISELLWTEAVFNIYRFAIVNKILFLFIPQY